jgi:hypothetical protein
MKISGWYRRDAGKAKETEAKFRRSGAVGGESITGVWMTFVDEEGRHIDLNFSAGEFAQLVSQGARVLNVLALKHFVERAMPVHVLVAGRAVCDVAHKYLYPKNWPSGHTWVRQDEAELATCKGCLGDVDWRPHPSYADWQVADYKGFRLIVSPDMWQVLPLEEGRCEPCSGGSADNIDAAKSFCIVSADSMEAALKGLSS